MSLDIEALRLTEGQFYASRGRTTQYPELIQAATNAQLAKALGVVAEWLVDIDTVAALGPQESVATLERLAKDIRGTLEQANIKRPTVEKESA